MQSCIQYNVWHQVKEEHWIRSHFISAGRCIIQFRIVFISCSPLILQGFILPLPQHSYNRQEVMRCPNSFYFLSPFSYIFRRFCIFHILLLSMIRIDTKVNIINRLSFTDLSFVAYTHYVLSGQKIAFRLYLIAGVMLILI